MADLSASTRILNMSTPAQAVGSQRQDQFNLANFVLQKLGLTHQQCVAVLGDPANVAELDHLFGGANPPLVAAPATRPREGIPIIGSGASKLAYDLANAAPAQALPFLAMLLAECAFDDPIAQANVASSCSYTASVAPGISLGDYHQVERIRAKVRDVLGHMEVHSDVKRSALRLLPYNANETGALLSSWITASMNGAALSASAHQIRSVFFEALLNGDTIKANAARKLLTLTGDPSAFQCMAILQSPPTVTPVAAVRAAPKVVPRMRTSVQGLWDRPASLLDTARLSGEKGLRGKQIQVIVSADLEARSESDRAYIEARIWESEATSPLAQVTNTSTHSTRSIPIVLNGKEEWIKYSIDAFEADEDGNILALGNDQFWEDISDPVFDIERQKKELEPLKKESVELMGYWAYDSETGYTREYKVAAEVGADELVRLGEPVLRYFAANPDAEGFDFYWKERRVHAVNWMSYIPDSEREVLKKKLRQYENYFVPTGELLVTPNQHGNIVFSQSYLIDVFHKKVDELMQSRNSGGPPVSVFDIGCATGSNTGALVRKHGAQLKLTGLDLSKSSLAAFRGMLSSEARAQVSLSIGAFPQVCNLKEGSCDLILHSHVLHYLSIDDMKTTFARIHGLLARGGALFLQALTPYSKPYAWREGVSRISREHGAHWPGTFGGSWASERGFAAGVAAASSTMPAYGGNPVYLQELKAEIESAGFEVRINFGRFDLPGCPATLESPLGHEEHEWFITRPLKETGTDRQKALGIESRLLAQAPALHRWVIMDRYLYAGYLQEREDSVNARSPKVQERELSVRHEYVAQPWPREPKSGYLAEPLLHPVPTAVQELAKEFKWDLSQPWDNSLKTLACVHVIATRKSPDEQSVNV